MPNAARQTDMHTCPVPGSPPHVGGPIQGGSGDVLIEMLPAARATDEAVCAAGGPDKIAQGCKTVKINHKHAARVSDMTTHGGVIVKGAPKVMIGVKGDAITVLPIEGAGGGAAKKEDGKGGKGGKGNNGGENGKGEAGKGDGTKESEAGAATEGEVFARFRLVSPERPRVGDELVFECSSWDPDTDGTSEAPNPERIAQRTWGLSGPGIETATGDTGREPRWVVRTTPIPAAATSDGPGAATVADLEISVILEVVDEQGHRATSSLTVGLRQNNPESPIAKFDLFAQSDGSQVNLAKDVDDLIIGQQYEARSLSFDPDDAPDGTALAGIVSHKWTAGFPLPGDTTSPTLSFTAPAFGSNYRLSLEVKDNEGLVAIRTVHFNTRALNDCAAAKRVKAAAYANLSVADYLMGRPQTSRTWGHWLSASGAELIYPTEWYRGYFSVKDAESEFALKVLSDADRSLKSGSQQRPEIGGSGRCAVTLYAELLYSDLGTSMGNHSLLYQYDGQAYKDGDYIFAEGTVHFRAIDRFNWQRGKAFLSYIGVTIPILDVTVVVPGAVNDTYWQVLEDCGHAKPFNMGAVYSLRFKFGRGPFGPVIRWL